MGAACRQRPHSRAVLLEHPEHKSADQANNLYQGQEGGFPFSTFRWLPSRCLLGSLQSILKLELVLTEDNPPFYLSSCHYFLITSHSDLNIPIYTSERPVLLFNCDIGAIL